MNKCFQISPVNYSLTLSAATCSRFVANVVLRLIPRTLRLVGPMNTPAHLGSLADLRLTGVETLEISASIIDQSPIRFVVPTLTNLSIHTSYLRNGHYRNVHRDEVLRVLCIAPVLETPNPPLRAKISCPGPIAIPTYHICANCVFWVISPLACILLTISSPPGTYAYVSKHRRYISSHTPILETFDSRSPTPTSNHGRCATKSSLSRAAYSHVAAAAGTTRGSARCAAGETTFPPTATPTSRISSFGSRCERRMKMRLWVNLRLENVSMLDYLYRVASGLAVRGLCVVGMAGPFAIEVLRQCATVKEVVLEQINFQPADPHESKAWTSSM